MKSAIVTGATGFIGGRLIPALLGRNVMVCALTRRPTGGIPGVTRMAVIGRQPLSDLISETSPDVVFHLAGVSDEGAAHRDPALALDANGRAVWQLMDAIHQTAHRPVVVLASSVAVYGATGDTPATENNHLRGETPYALSKIVGEMAARAFAGLGLDIRIARIGNIFGPGDRNVGRLIPDTLNAIRGNRAPVLRAPDSLRSHLHVDDCARGLIALAGTNGAALSGRAVNICAEHGITNMDLVKLILARAGREDLHPRRADYTQAGTIRLASAALARRTLGWAPELSLEEGFGDLLETHAA